MPYIDSDNYLWDTERMSYEDELNAWFERNYQPHADDTASEEDVTE